MSLQKLFLALAGTEVEHFVALPGLDGKLG